jgi:phenylalanine-4-hydroxylase
LRLRSSVVQRSAFVPHDLTEPIEGRSDGPLAGLSAAVKDMYDFSELHRLTGEATHRLADEENLRFLSRVFWFTLEFGVVVEDGELRAYGAGILSSYGEIDEFRGMEHRPIDLVEMGTADYDITRYQPVLYRAESLDEVREVVGGFIASCTDESIAEMRAGAVPAAA